MSGLRTDSERIPFASIEVRHGTSLHLTGSIQDQSSHLTLGAALLGLVQR